MVFCSSSHSWLRQQSSDMSLLCSDDLPGLATLQPEVLLASETVMPPLFLLSCHPTSLHSFTDRTRWTTYYRQDTSTSMLQDEILISRFLPVEIYCGMWSHHSGMKTQNNLGAAGTLITKAWMFLLFLELCTQLKGDGSPLILGARTQHSWDLLGQRWRESVGQVLASAEGPVKLLFLVSKDVSRIFAYQWNYLTKATLIENKNSNFVFLPGRENHTFYCLLAAQTYSEPREDAEVQDFWWHLATPSCIFALQVSWMVGRIRRSKHKPIF